MDAISIISKPFTYEEDFHKEALQIRDSFLSAIDSGSPQSLYDIKKRIIKLSALWSRKKEVRIGYKAKSFYVDRAYGSRFLFTVNHFFHTKLLYKRNDNDETKTEFSVRQFANMVSVQAAYHLAKFGEMREYELMMASIIILMKYFVLFRERQDGYAGNEWCISSDDIRKVLTNFSLIIRNDKDFFRYVKRPIAIPGTPSSEKIDIKKPECADDYLRFYRKGMSVNDWVDVLMKEWNEKRRTVYYHFSKFGIEPKKVAHRMSAEEEVRMLREILKRNNISI
jgi:hypothetical protein